MKQNSFSQTGTNLKIFQNNPTAQKAASLIVAELQQLDSLKKLTSSLILQHQIKDSISVQKDSIITAQQRVIHRVKDQQLLIITQYTESQEQNKRLQESLAACKEKKPKRRLWLLAGIVSGIVGTVLVLR